jgi:hypothetical protein
MKGLVKTFLIKIRFWENQRFPENWILSVKFRKSVPKAVYLEYK